MSRIKSAERGTSRPEVHWGGVIRSVIPTLLAPLVEKAEDGIERHQAASASRRSARENRRALKAIKSPDEYSHTHRNNSFKFGWGNNNDSSEAQKLRNIRRT